MRLDAFKDMRALFRTFREVRGAVKGNPTELLDEIARDIARGQPGREAVAARLPNLPPELGDALDEIIAPVADVVEVKGLVNSGLLDVMADAVTHNPEKD